MQSSRGMSFSLLVWGVRAPHWRHTSYAWACAIKQGNIHFLVCLGSPCAALAAYFFCMVLCNRAGECPFPCLSGESVRRIGGILPMHGPVQSSRGISISLFVWGVRAPHWRHTFSAWSCAIEQGNVHFPVCLGSPCAVLVAYFFRMGLCIKRGRKQRDLFPAPFLCADTGRTASTRQFSRVKTPARCSRKLKGRREMSESGIS